MVLYPILNVMMLNLRMHYSFFAILYVYLHITSYLDSPRADFHPIVGSGGTTEQGVVMFTKKVRRCSSIAVGAASLWCR